jgi:hypothetical protein
MALSPFITISNTLKKLNSRITRLERIRRITRSPLGGGAAAAATTAPFTIAMVLAGGGPNYSVTLWPGAINQLVPTDMFTTVTYVAASTVYVHLDVTTDGRKITAAAIVIDGTSPVAMPSTSGLAPTSFGLLIGVITNNTVYQINSGLCTATIATALTEDKAAPVPGQSPYLYWYTWTVAFA